MRFPKHTQRPSFVEIIALDPFDGGPCCSCKAAFTRRQSASGYYTDMMRRTLKAARLACGHILEGREPIPSVKLHWKP